MGSTETLLLLHVAGTELAAATKLTGMIIWSPNFHHSFTESSRSIVTVVLLIGARRGRGRARSAGLPRDALQPAGGVVPNVPADASSQTSVLWVGGLPRKLLPGVLEKIFGHVMGLLPSEVTAGAKHEIKGLGFGIPIKFASNALAKRALHIWRDSDEFCWQDKTKAARVQLRVSFCEQFL